MPRGGGGGGGGRSGRGGRGKRKKATQAEARAAVKPVLVHLFAVPAVLRGKKPIAELSGLVWVAGTVGVIFVRLAITTASQNIQRGMAGSMYLRDSRQFVIDLLKRIVLSALSCVVRAAGFWFRRRVEICWQKKITDGLHTAYFHDNFFYRQTLRPEPIADPGQRIVRDVMMLTGQLTRFCQGTISCCLEASWAVARLCWLMPDRWWYAPLIVAVQWLTILWRNWFANALKRGMLSAKASRASGVYRDAHSKLANNAESIISFGGVAAEARRIMAKLDETLQLSRKMNNAMLRDTVAMNVSRELIGMTMTYSLTHLPFIGANHPLKVADTASEELRMQANANMLGEMQFTGALIRDVRGEVGQLMRAGRTMMQLSGYAIRIAELLDATGVSGAATADAKPKAAPAGSDAAAISLRDVDIKTPTGVALVDGLSFSVAKGENLLVCGENGVGKTSVFRTLARLWPAPDKRIGCPERTCFLPQTPYFPLGSLHEAVCYPKRAADSALSAEDLRGVLAEVGLESLLERESSASHGVDWNAALSLGEKQQLALARAILAQPEFLILDEATSAIKSELEEDLFEKLAGKGVTLVTATHSAALLPYHSRILRIKGAAAEGGRGWSIKDIEEGDEAEFSAPPPQLHRTLSAAQRAEASEREAAAAAQCLAERSAPFAAKAAAKALPQMGDLRRTLLLARLMIKWENLLGDESLLRLGAYLALMAAGTWVTTGYLSGVPGALQALVIQSDRAGYARFMARVTLMRLVSMGLSAGQQYMRSGVSVIWRERMTRAITERYLANNNFYAMKHCDGRIKDAETRITQEISQVVMNLNYMIMRITRPVLDAAYCTVLLIRIQMPWAGLVAMWGYGVVGLGMIKLVAPDFAHFAAEDERVMANFRGVHDRVVEGSESIAFHGGGPREEEMANAANDKVLNLLHKKNDQRAAWNACDSFLLRRTPDFITQVLRMFWSFGQGTDGEVLAVEGGTRMAATSEFIGRLIERSFDTFSSLLGLHEEVQELFGSARRVSDVVLVIDELDNDRLADAARVAETQQAATPRRGERICLTDACIVAPDGMCLARGLSFSVESSGLSNLLITGPNGCGKTAVSRVLSSVWNVSAGGVGRPEGMVVVPQQALVPTLELSLLDLLAYPAQLEAGSEEEAAAIATLAPLMRRLRVGYLVERNDEGWHAVQAWDKLLSMGEGQCLGIVRALYRKPRWAVLDEPTSAMSEEVAGVAYDMLKQQGISYVTISQSSALARFHTQQLRLGEANADGWSLSGVDKNLDAGSNATVAKILGGSNPTIDKILAGPSPRAEGEGGGKAGTPAAATYNRLRNVTSLELEEEQKAGSEGSEGVVVSPPPTPAALDDDQSDDSENALFAAADAATVASATTSLSVPEQPQWPGRPAAAANDGAIDEDALDDDAASSASASTTSSSVVVVEAPDSPGAPRGAQRP